MDGMQSAAIAQTCTKLGNWRSPEMYRSMREPRKYRPTDWPRLMTAAMACAYLGGISAECFARCVATRVRAVRWPGQSFLYDRADLDRWLDEGAPPGTAKSDAEWLAELEK
jgi:hypothetical protein